MSESFQLQIQLKAQRWALFSSLKPTCSLAGTKVGLRHTFVCHWSDCLFTTEACPTCSGKEVTVLWARLVNLSHLKCQVCESVLHQEQFRVESLRKTWPPIPARHPPPYWTEERKWEHCLCRLQRDKDTTASPTASAIFTCSSYPHLYNSSHDVVRVGSHSSSI